MKNNSLQVENHIEAWKQKLIDLTRRNRLLYYKPTKSSTLSISAPDCLTVFAHLVKSEKSWKFRFPSESQEQESESKNPQKQLIAVSQPVNQPLQDTRKADELVCDGLSRKELERVLQNLYRRSRTDYQERGVYILHAVFGMLSWKEAEHGIGGGVVCSPMILCPVELKRETARDPFELSMAEEDLVLNPALQVKLQRDFNLVLPPLPENWEQASLTEYFAQASRLVEPLQWSVEATAKLGLFSFHKLVIHRDLIANADSVKEHRLIRALAGGQLDNEPSENIPEERQLDTIQQPGETFQILDADSSQQQCIQAALRRRSLVVQGPPGTGKSQTIANLIAEFIARGKTVLFVSEKMAALEVVYKRLREAQLGDFCLQLHSHKASKREVVAELKKCLDESLIPRHLPTEADFQKLKQLRESLNDYTLALHEVREPLEQSAYTVLAKLAALHSISLIPFSSVDATQVRPALIQEWESWVRRLATVWPVAVEGQNFPWCGCKETDFTLATRTEWLAFLEQLASPIQQLSDISRQYSNELRLNAPETLAEAHWMIQVGDHLSRRTAINASWLTIDAFDQLLYQAKGYQAISEDYHKRRKELSQSYDDGFLELPLGTAKQLQDARQQIEPLLLPGDSQGHAFLQQRNELLKFAEESRQLAEESLSSGQKLAATFGLPSDNLTLERTRELAQLAVLCHTEPRPEPSWLDSVRLQEARDLVARIRPQYKDYNDKKAALLSNYDENFLNLDVDRLIENFGGSLYRSPMRSLHPGFHKDKKTILRTTRAHTISSSILEDLLAARELLRLQRQIESECKQVKTTLGRFYKVYETDFETTERGLKIAAIVIKLAAVNPIPNQLIQSIASSTPPTDLDVIGKNLFSTINQWEQSAQNWTAFIPLQQLPGSTLSFKQSPLVDIRQWATSLMAPLHQLCDISARVLLHRKEQQNVTLLELIQDLEKGEGLRSIQTRVEADSERLRNQFGDRYNGINTLWNEVLVALLWTQEMRQLFSALAIPKQFVVLVSQDQYKPPAVDELRQTYQHAAEQFQKLLERFEAPSSNSNEIFGKPLHTWLLTELQTKIRTLHTRIDDLQLWTDYKKLRDRFSQVGLDGFLSLLEKQPAAQLVETFHKSFYQDWINRYFSRETRLSEFRGQHHEILIEQFRRIDLELVRYASQRVIERCNAQRPQPALLQTNDSEVDVLKREAAKKTRHFPVRKLFERIPNLLPRLKPCMMMSPLSVSQFLHPEYVKFDLVIFDEASQIFTEDAVGAIYRANQIIVAGDSKQLPPTNFFDSLDKDDGEIDEELEDETPANFQSLLDECGAKFPEHLLRWHYRSRHESLIAFSNHRFYDNRLITFPAARHESKNLGIKFVHVADGVYDRGGKKNNLREAEIVTDRVLEHFAQYPKKSLGVIAFSQSQMTTILDEVERRRREHPELEKFFKDDRLEGFFVKNLETVQGDERDVIIFSIGYGKDQQGRMSMNFGPLNKQGGERRLNVAVTRAREKVVLVSSIRASNIDLRGTQAAGVLNLHHYLDYAERGEAALQISHPQGQGETESPLEDEVAAAIRSLGYDVVTQVGCSGYRIDMAVIDPALPGQFLLGVECDGATYHSAATARDRDRLRQQVLESLGWRIHRIWSPDWVTKRDVEIARLRSAIEKAREYSPAGDSDSPAEHESQIPEVERVQIAQTKNDDFLPGTIHYSICTMTPPKWLGEFHLPEQRAQQCGLLVKIVNKEGPIHIELATRRLLTVWGISRSGPRISSAVEEAVRNCEQRKQLITKGKFLWPIELTDTPVRVPVIYNGESLRAIEHIPPEEIQAAMLLLLHHAAGLSVDSLITETARLFGYSRTGDKIKERLQGQVKALTSKGSIKKNGDSLTP